MKMTMVGNDLLAFVCWLFVITGSASAQTVINGSFESGISPGSGTTLYAVDSTTIDGWTVQDGSVDYTEDRWAGTDGHRCIDMTGVSGGTLTQTISGFTNGQIYRLKFRMAGNPEGGPSIKSMKVRIGSKTRIFTFDGSNRSASDMGWSEFALDFTATNSTLTLAFSGLDDGIWGAALDAVSIVDPPLELSIRCSQVEFCWPSLTNEMYQLQYRSTLTTNMWMNLAPPIQGTGSNNCFLDVIPAGRPQRFYQVIRL